MLLTRATPPQVVIWANYDGKKSLIAPSDMDPLTIGHLKNGSNLFYLHWISSASRCLADVSQAEPRGAVC